MSRALAVVLSFGALLLLAACGGSSSEPDATPTATVPPAAERYEQSSCPFDVPAGETAECGYLTVPENRVRPADGSIRIAVAVFKSHSPTPSGRPIVSLAGGPGASVLSYLSFGLFPLFSRLLESRDVIFYDMRGAGLSQPSLECPEVDAAVKEGIVGAGRVTETSAAVVAAHRACHDRLLQQGIALDAYNSIAAAADLDDLRQALELETWDVYGASYGTRLALTYMRDFPNGIGSVVLDSTFPLEEDLSAEYIPDLRAALGVLFGGCQANAGCAAAFPNLERDLFDTVERLDGQPEPTSIVDENGSDLAIQVSGDEVLAGLFLGLYNEAALPTMPIAIEEASQGDLTRLSDLLDDPIVFSDAVSDGLYASVQCNEDISFSPPDSLENVGRDIPELHDLVVGDYTYDICKFWGAGKAPASENEPVASDIPTLILSGEYDPITPAAWGRQVASSLANSFFFQYPGLTHAVGYSSSPCPVDMVLSFLADPASKPDDSCIAALSPPAFVTP